MVNNKKSSTETMFLGLVWLVFLSILGYCFYTISYMFTVLLHNH
ncbi:hypothetical protein V9K67_04360 [Paraflavisolibacter sp. H34]